MKKNIVTLAATLVLALFSNGAFAQQAAPAAWAGWARCQVSVQGPGYTDLQTHTWTIAGGAPTAQGAFQIYAGTWAVVGGGSLSRTQGTQTLMAQWATNGPNISAPIAVFVRASDKHMFIQARHAPLRSAAAIQGYQQVTIAGKPQTPGKIAAEAFEWAFPVIAASAPVPPDTNATATGSSTSPVSGSVGPMQPAGSQATASCTWQFGQGAAAPAPPPTLPAQAIPTPGNPATTSPPANNPPGTTTPPGSSAPPATNPPVSTTPPTSSAKLVSVSPTTVEQGAIGTTVTLTGQGTHWLQTKPTVVVAPDIGVPVRNLQATSDTELLAQFDVQYAAVTGARTITVTAGSEVVSLPNAFTVTARARPVLVSVTPNRAKQGARNLTVQLTGRNTRWAQGATRVQIARPVDASQPGVAAASPGVTVISTTVHSPTSASAVLNVDDNAVVGSYWFSVFDAALSDGLNIVDGFTVETASTTPPSTGGSPPGSGVQPGADAAQAPLVARHPANMSQSTPQTEIVSAAPTAPGTSQWWKIVAEDSPASATPLLQFVASISGGPADRIYEIDLVEGTSAGLVNRGLSANVNAPVASGRWSNVAGSDDGKTFFVVVRHVSGAPTADKYRLTMEWGGSQPYGSSPATARLAGVAPTSIEQGVGLSDVITLTGEGTHWQQGTTTVNFGPGITIQGGVRVLSPTSLTTQLTVAYAAAHGPRAISVTTGNESVTLANALTVVAREQPVITQISPDNAVAGAQNVTVTFTGRGTRWEQGKTVILLNNAPGLTQASAVRVNSPTSMTVSLNIAASAAPGPREITVLNPGVVVGSDIITVAGGFTVNLPGPPPPLTATPLDPSLLPTPVLCTLRGPARRTPGPNNYATPVSAHLYWNAVAGATGYTVSRSDLGVLTSRPLADVDTSFVHRAVLPHPRTYVYTITATYPQGCGSTNFTLTSQPPATPYVSHAMGSEAGQVRLAWSWYNDSVTHQVDDYSGILITGPALPPAGREVQHGGPGAHDEILISGVPAGSRTWTLKAYWNTPGGRVMDNTGRTITVMVP